MKLLKKNIGSAPEARSRGVAFWPRGISSGIRDMSVKHGPIQLKGRVPKAVGASGVSRVAPERVCQ